MFLIIAWAGGGKYRAKPRRKLARRRPLRESHRPRARSLSTRCGGTERPAHRGETLAQPAHRRDAPRQYDEETRLEIADRAGEVRGQAGDAGVTLCTARFILPAQAQNDLPWRLHARASVRHVHSAGRRSYSAGIVHSFPQITSTVL